MTYKVISIFIIILTTNSIFANNKQNNKNVLNLNTLNKHLTIKVKSWQSLRDQNIIKQDFDYSCSAAAIATILNFYYGQNVTETTILEAINKTDGLVSFADMSDALIKFGFKAQGFAASFAQLTKLKMPVIVYVKHRKTEHFAVLKGINNKTVIIADPSLGNRTYSKTQFIKMWYTRLDEKNNLAGKFLAIFPADTTTPIQQEFFVFKPMRQTKKAINQLNFRNLE